ncbi:MAG: YkgJ family cysteine cluster protein [Rhodocyclaceae bacterium]|nr:YkgJ family cysteine cluster protein [Rhodocyclaceae bacterium]
MGLTEGNPLFGTGATALPCRSGCAACCIAPSISSLDKPAGVACGHLTGDLRCGLFGQPKRPACCASLQPSAEMCGATRDQALAWLAALETATCPT